MVSDIRLFPTYVGTFIGFVAFLFLGAIPGILYGGYMGMATASVLFGAPLTSSIFVKAVVFGGMFLGLVASFFFFLVMGSFIGTAVGFPFQPLLRKLVKRRLAHLSFLKQIP